jgi:hypothetical protein
LTIYVHFWFLWPLLEFGNSSLLHPQFLT